mmetsp:Transcript_14840/g.58208  ORF Transcript_14840/g.58208 Transcript_14840/m.58208 type:complete len:516 (-) Transcript_14840:70-1617(-)
MSEAHRMAASKDAKSPSNLCIGNYRLAETLGVGSFSKVKLGYHVATGLKVAVKILNRQKIKSLSMDAKIRREIQILKLFRHPHIIKLYEVIETPTDIFMVMEYVPGGELFEYIVRHGKLSEDEARKFFQQILYGVDYCHRQRVVHRDLKPENLLLDSKNNVKIADFGLSNLMRDGDLLKTSCGSPNYAAPEVISGQLYAGAEVDIWSCGVILFALLCARLPFDDEYIPDLFKKIRTGAYSMPAHLSQECKQLIASMLVVDPLKRSTISEIRSHPWVTRGLPAYLETVPMDIQSSHAILDPDNSVLQQIMSDFRIARNNAIAELAAESENGEANQYQVAYNLISDHRTTAREEQKSPVPAHSMRAAMLSTSPPMNMREQSPFDLSRLGKKPLPGTPPSSSAIDAMEAGNPKQMWKLGIASFKAPKQIMDELYATLVENNLEWKIISPYHLRCRPKGTDRKLKVAAQLFKVRTGNYLLDFKKLEGDTCSFMGLCAQLRRTFDASMGTEDDDRWLGLL